MRAVCLVALMVASAHADDRVAADAELEAGVLLQSHAKVTGSWLHGVFDDRAYVEARLGAGASTSLYLVEDRLGLGAVFHPGRRVDLRLGWRFGTTYFGGHIGSEPYGRTLLVAEVVVQLGFALSPCWQLRVVPLSPSLYWRHTYGVTVGIEIGVERAL
jgi:hypothetical protein